MIYGLFGSVSSFESYCGGGGGGAAQPPSLILQKCVVFLFEKYVSSPVQ